MGVVRWELSDRSGDEALIASSPSSLARTTFGSDGFETSANSSRRDDVSKPRVSTALRCVTLGWRTPDNTINPEGVASLSESQFVPKGRRLEAQGEHRLAVRNPGWRTPDNTINPEGVASHGRNPFRVLCLNVARYPGRRGEAPLALGFETSLLRSELALSRHRASGRRSFGAKTLALTARESTDCRLARRLIVDLDEITWIADRATNTQLRITWRAAPHTFTAESNALRSFLFS